MNAYPKYAGCCPNRPRDDSAATSTMNARNDAAMTTKASQVGPGKRSIQPTSPSSQLGAKGLSARSFCLPCASRAASVVISDRV
jgi:hypothetical protein